ncbi:MAG: phage virion morphogenesis protein [Desulfobulbaceae bacterium]|nr:phage virion morphogenesis protein [Desulfobulbaceae bacterium]
MIKIPVDDKQVQALLARLSQRAGNLSPLMRKISEDMRDAVEENFETQEASLGKRWEPSARAIRQGAALARGTAPGKVRKPPRIEDSRTPVPRVRA